MCICFILFFLCSCLDVGQIYSLWKSRGLHCWNKSKRSPPVVAFLLSPHHSSLLPMLLYTIAGVYRRSCDKNHSENFSKLKLTIFFMGHFFSQIHYMDAWIFVLSKQYPMQEHDQQTGGLEQHNFKVNDKLFQR